jgi:WD40 repeat protein
VDSLAFTRDGLSLFQSLRYGGEVVVWDLSNGQERFRFGTTNSGLKLALSPDETLVATVDGRDYAANGPGEIVLWDAHSGRELARAPAQPTWLIRVTFSPDGRYLATSGGLGHAKIWSVPDLRQVAVLPHDGQRIVFALAFSPDGRSLATGTSDGLLRIWEWES